MALKPSLSFLRIGSAAAPHTLEVYVDYLCPFSRKITASLDQHVVPLISEGGPLSGKVQLLLRLYPQPWHATSPLLHEAALSFGRIAPEHSWAFTKVLMEGQEEFFDRPAANLSSTEIRQALVKLAGPLLVTQEQKASLLNGITFKTSPNGGVDVTADLKYFVKLGRQNGVHVTPTALWDGLLENSISSSFGQSDWESFFKDNVAV